MKTVVSLLHREWLDSTRERRVIDTSNGYCRFSGRRTRSTKEGRCSKNSITRYESMWQVLNRNYVVGRAYEREHRWKPIGETYDDIVCTQPGCWPIGMVGAPTSNIFSTGCYEWLAIIDAVVGLPITPARKSSDSRRNVYGYTSKRAYRSSIPSPPASTIHYWPCNGYTVHHSQRPDVALTLLNNLDMFITL